MSSNKKELPTASLESSVISTLMLEITCKEVQVANHHICFMNFLNNQEERSCHTQTYIWRNTSSIIVVIPVQSTYSVQLLYTKNLNKPKDNVRENEKIGVGEREREREALQGRDHL